MLTAGSRQGGTVFGGITFSERAQRIVLNDLAADLKERFWSLSAGVEWGCGVVTWLQRSGRSGVRLLTGDVDKDLGSKIAWKEVSGDCRPVIFAIT